MIIRGYLFDSEPLHLAGVHHKLWRQEDFASDLLVLKLASYKTIKALVELDSNAVGDVAVVCAILYFTILRLYVVNAKEVSWKERLIYHWASLLWFTSFDGCAGTMYKNQKNMVIETIGMMFLFPLSDFYNPRLASSEPCEHTFGSYRKIEREFIVETLMQIQDMNG